MRTLKINEEELKKIIEHIINENFLGIGMKELRNELEANGFKVSPQVVNRNILKLIKERKIKLNSGKIKHA